MPTLTSAFNAPGLAISAFAKASRVLAGQPKPEGSRFPVEGAEPSVYLEAAVKAAAFIRDALYGAAVIR